MACRLCGGERPARDIDVIIVRQQIKGVPQLAHSDAPISHRALRILLDEIGIDVVSAFELEEVQQRRCSCELALALPPA